MRLEKRYIDVKKVVFDDKTFMENGVLHVSKKELEDVAMDYRFKSVDFELAHPGESCRLTHVCDCVQPMYKLDNSSTFPGVVDEVKRVGIGTTVVLRGVSITEILLIPMGGLLLDMSSPGREMSELLSNQIHICLLAEPADGVQNNEYFNAVSVASKKIAKYVAQCAKDCVPDEVQIFELKKDNLENLPRVAYISQIFSHAYMNDTTFYGDNCASMLPTIVHPNEILDGALLFRDYHSTANSAPSFVIQNHPVILELMARHGKDLNFVGVILSNTPAEIVNKNRNAMMNASLAKYHLNADGVIVTKQGGGHPQIDTGLTCDYCEELGVKTVLMLTEFLSANTSIEELVLFNTPNANAMVSNGCLCEIKLPKVDRLIGLNKSFRIKGDLKGPLTASINVIRESISQQGNTNLTTVVY